LALMFVVASFSNGDRLLALTPTGNGYWDGTWIPTAATAGAARVRIRVDAQTLHRGLSSFIEITGGVNSGVTTPVITPGRVVNAASPGVTAPGRDHERQLRPAGQRQPGASQRHYRA